MNDLADNLKRKNFGVSINVDKKWSGEAVYDIENINKEIEGLLRRLDKKFNNERSQYLKRHESRSSQYRQKRKAEKDYTEMRAEAIDQPNE